MIIAITKNYEDMRKSIRRGVWWPEKSEVIQFYEAEDIKSTIIIKKTIKNYRLRAIGSHRVG